MKIVINVCYGGIGFSEELYDELGIKWSHYGHLQNEDLGIQSENDDEYRANLKLINAIEKIGCERAANELAELKIVDIPNGIDWEVDEYDGKEEVREVSGRWS